MYDPVKDGVDKSIDSVSYIEAPPPTVISELVHCFWELKTDSELEDDFVLHALPDACVNILFNQLDLDIAGVTQLQTEHTTLNLGRSFHYVGIQFFPGVWRGDPESTVDHYVGDPYEGELPLVDTNLRLANVGFEEMSELFLELIHALEAQRIVAPNPVTAALLRNVDSIRSVADMAHVAGLSTRQLQRTLKATTGFSPHNLLKVLRLQQSFRQDYLLSFADQSHFTHSFREITGYTPAKFRERFDV